MIAYGLGDAGTGLAATQLGFYLFVFFTDTAGLDALIAGSLLMAIKIWDGINDPLIGWLSDHTRSRWGPRLPWMLAAALPPGISLAAMWWVPPGDVAQKTAYYVVIAILLMTAYTSVNLPYAALTTELTTDSAVRTRLNAARFTGSILAGASGLILAPFLLEKGANGYVEMGRISGTIAVVATLACCWGLAPFAKKARRPSGQAEPIKRQLARILRNRRFLQVLGLYLLLWCGLQLMQPVALIYLIQVMHIPAVVSTWMLLLFQISALVGLQAWSLCANRYGRIKALHWGAYLWIIACLLAIVLPPLSLKTPQIDLYLITLHLTTNGADGLKMLALVATILLVGFGASTAYLIPWSLLPDAIDADPDKPAGLYTAWMVLIQKLGIGVSIQLLGVLLWASGYRSADQSSGALTFMQQPEIAITTIRLCMGLIPALLVAMGILVMRRWPEKGAHLKNAT